VEEAELLVCSTKQRAVSRLRAIIATAEKVKSVKPDVLIPALHQLKNFQGLTGEFSWDDKGERIGSPFVAFTVNADGSYTIVYPASATK
jgi:branched-chain amino acid transport system substrate-binding protein